MIKKQLAILIDSTGIDNSRIETHPDIYMQPLSITFGHTTYTDLIDIKPETFYEMLKTHPDHPFTSQPVIGEVITQFEKLLTQYEHILVLSLTSKLSGTYSGFIQAAEIVGSQNIHIIDTQCTGPSAFIIAEHALSLLEEGFSVDAIVLRIQSLVPNMQLFVYIDTLSYLARSGRLSGAKALVGNLIQMKTNLVFHDGKPEIINRVRTAKKAISQMVDAALSTMDSKTQTLYLCYADFKRPEVCDDIKHYILSKRPSLFIRETIIPAVLGNNSGPGGLAISYVNTL